MKSRRIVQGLALLAALVLCLPAGLAEELGEMDLYDPSIHVEGALPEPAPSEEPAEEPPEAVIEVEAIVAPEASVEPSPAPGEDAEVLPEAELATEEPTPEASPEPTPEPSAEPSIEPGGDVVAAAPDLCMGVGEKYSLDGATLLGGRVATGYASDQPAVATVDAATGLVTAVARGTAVIKVSSGSVSTTCRVLVLSAPDKLVFPARAVNLGKGESRSFAASLPENTGAARITYVSSKPKVVRVDAAGNLIAKKTGTAIITARAYNGAKATCAVRVMKAPSRLTLSAKKAALCVGESRKLSVTLSKRSASAIAWSSDKPGIVTVDAAGNLTGVAPGTATVTARTFNNKRAVCKVTVLDGAPPTAVSLGLTELRLGRQEKFRLTPSVGAGEAAVYAFASSRKKIAAVSADGVITAKKKGTAVIVVATQNGKKASVKVTVGNAPRRVALSPGTLTLQEGQTGQLRAVLPAGTASTLRWESGNTSVATVDADGLVTAVKPGTAVIRATTFNRKTAQCKVVVSGVGGETIEVPEPGTEAPRSAAQMAANLRGSSALGAKRDAIANVVLLLMNKGFEPAFAAGVGANIYAEGTYGLFESSKYISNYKSRPRYFCYLDGGNYYTKQNGTYKLTAVYLSKEELEAYTGSADKRLRFAEKNFYLDNYSGKYVQNVDLNRLEALMTTLAQGGWQGKFGLGIVQWTGARTRTLVSFYRRHAGEGGSITAAQVMAAENEMILYDLRGDYAYVYNAWKSANGAPRSSENAARSAGSLICLKYEVPVNKEAKAITRGNKAAEIYRIMMGG